MKQQSKKEYSEINDDISWYELIERNQDNSDGDKSEEIYDERWRRSYELQRVSKKERKLFILQKNLKRKISFSNNYIHITEVFLIRYAEFDCFGGEWNIDYSVHPCWTVEIDCSISTVARGSVRFASYTPFLVLKQHRRIGLGNHLLNELIRWIKVNYGDLQVSINISLMEGTPEIVARKLYTDRNIKDKAFVKDLKLKESKFKVISVADELISLSNQKRELRTKGKTISLFLEILKEVLGVCRKLKEY